MKNIIKNIVLGITLVASLFMFTGCKKYESNYTKYEATKMMKEYIKEKYGETPEFEYVKAYSDVALNEILSLGYYAKTTESLIAIKYLSNLEMKKMNLHFGNHYGVVILKLLNMMEVIY